MFRFFVGLTILVAHLLLFFGQDFFELAVLVKHHGTFVLGRYALAACLVGLFFKINNLAIRLVRPIHGRSLVGLGTSLYLFSVALVAIAGNAHGPGAAIVAMPATYIVPVAMILILWGTARALLEASPSGVCKSHEP